MDNAEDCRKKAEECLREAESAPAGLRLQLITIAQRWFELSDAIKRRAPECDGKVANGEK
jgi:hypothetical protein